MYLLNQVVTNVFFLNMNTMRNRWYFYTQYYIYYVPIIDDSIMLNYNRAPTFLPSQCILIILYYNNTIVVDDVKQYIMLISHHNVVSYKNRFHHDFTNTRAAHTTKLHNNVIPNTQRFFYVFYEDCYI